MRKTSFILALILCVLSACKHPEPEPVQPNPANVLTFSITDGDVVYADALSEIILTYFHIITIEHPEQITLNDTVVTAEVSREDPRRLVIKLPELRYDTDYTLHLAQGAISADYNGEIRLSAEVSLHFKTRPKKGDITGDMCNPDATEEAQRVFRYLKEQYGKKIISSSIANVNWNFDEAELVYRATGKYPKIATMDYIHMFTLTSHNPFTGWRVPYDDTHEVEKWCQAGGLIAACWHWNMPANESAIYDTNGYTCTPGSGTVSDKGSTTCAKPSHIMKEGSWEKKIADEDLAKMAELLKLLQNKGIAVIWRPLHEASGNTYGQYAGNGAWFWWGIEGAAAYKQLWRYMFDYLHNAGVNNLIWVWTSQNNGDTDWYPGDEYVDIIGQDIYDKGAASNAADYIKLQATYPDKIITLSECGSVGKISEQWAKGARWSYFMPWYQYNATTLDGHMHANTEWWKDAMKCDAVIAR